MHQTYRDLFWSMIYLNRKKHAGNIPSEMADFLLQFALKIKRLVALCIASPVLDENVMQDIRFRIAKKVDPVRKSFWFNIGGECPTRSDTTRCTWYNGIHYNELVEPVFSFPSPSLGFLHLRELISIWQVLITMMNEIHRRERWFNLPICLWLMTIYTVLGTGWAPRAYFESAA